MYSYQPIENYNYKKTSLLSMLNNNILQKKQGFEQDVFMSALIRTCDYFSRKYKKIRIPAEMIPDSKNFMWQKQNYTIPELIICRLANNVDSVDIDESYDYNAKTIANYIPQLKKILIFSKGIDEAARISEINNQLSNFSSIEEFKKIEAELIIVHEIIHAVSDNGKLIGLSDRELYSPSEKNVKLNEGITESLAIDIMGLADNTWRISFCPKGGIERFSLSSQSFSKYIFESNIASLMRMKTKENFDLPFLIDKNLIIYNDEVAHQYYGTNYSMDKISATLDALKLEEKSNYTSTELKEVQKLQAIILKDLINTNLEKFERIKSEVYGKLNEGQFEKLREFNKDVNIAANLILPSITSADKKALVYTDEINKYGKVLPIDYTSTKAITEALEKGKLNLSENLTSLMALLNAKTEINNSLNIAKPFVLK